MLVPFRFANGLDDPPPAENVKPDEGGDAPKLKDELPPNAGNDAFEALLSAVGPFRGGKLCEGVAAPNSPPPWGCPNEYDGMDCCDAMP